MSSSSLGIGLLLVGLILIAAGVPGVWLGINGIVINNETLHFGPTATAEINFGLTMISIGIVVLVVLAVLFFARRDLLKTDLPHFP